MVCYSDFIGKGGVNMNKELSKKVAKFKMDYHKLQICKINGYSNCINTINGAIKCDECEYLVVEEDMIETAKEIIDEFVKGSVDVENL